MLLTTEEFAQSDKGYGFFYVGWKKKPSECLSVWEEGSRAGWNFMRPQSKARDGGIMELEPGAEMTATNAIRSHTLLNMSINASHS